VAAARDTTIVERRVQGMRTGPNMNARLLPTGMLLLATQVLVVRLLVLAPWIGTLLLPASYLCMQQGYMPVRMHVEIGFLNRCR